MKKTTSILLLTGIIIMTSCSITKRRYMPGYYVHKNEKIQNTQDQMHPQAMNKQEQRKMALRTITSTNEKTIKQQMPKSNTLSEKSFKTQKTDDQYDKQLKEQNNHKKYQHGNLVAGILNPSLQQTDQLSDMHKYLADNQHDDGNTGLKVIGWILIILGLLILLFASILLGGIIMLLGLVFVIAA